MKLRIYADVKVKINTEDIHKSNVIYCLTFENGKKYIGLTTQSLDTRISSHCNTSFNKKNISFDTKKARAIRKYMYFEVSILYEGDNLNEQEIRFIELYDTYKNGYNSILGGEGCIGREFSEETKQKMSNTRKENFIKNPMSSETRVKISDANIGKKLTGETKDKMSKSKSKFCNKPVIQYNKNMLIINQFNSIIEAADTTKINRGNIVLVCNNIRKTAGGYL